MPFHILSLYFKVGTTGKVMQLSFLLRDRLGHEAWNTPTAPTLSGVLREGVTK